MILEILQLYDLLKGRFHALVFFFLFFVVIHSIIFRYFSGKYKPYINDVDISTQNVAVIYPLFKEDPSIIRKSLLSIYNQNPKEIIIIYDGEGSDLDVIREIKEIQHKLKIIKFRHRIGKRRAIVAGINSTDTEFVMTLDSDTILLGDNFLIDMLRPMVDKSIASVSPISTVYSNGSYLSFKLSRLVEASRAVVNKSLNGGLVVAYGSCALWRRYILIEQSGKYLDQHFLGVKCAAGEDRCLTREAEKEGYKTVVQSTAIIEISSPPTLKSYIRQHIRWSRSGIAYFIYDLKERNIPSKLFLFHCVTYYLAPIFFLAAILGDIIFFPSVFTRSLLITILMVCVGVTTITIFRANVKLRMNMNILDAFVCGLLGLFIIFPTTLYAYMTMYKQAWVPTSTSLVTEAERHK